MLKVDPIMDAKSKYLDVTEVELVYKSEVMPSERPKVGCSNDVYKVFMRSWDKGKIELQEQFKVLYLNRSNRCLGISTISLGSTHGCEVDLKLAFAAACKMAATGMIIAHNHPSGNLYPSGEDRKVTAQFAEAAQLLNIGLVDHLIVTKEGYYSFCDDGLLPPKPK